MTGNLEGINIGSDGVRIRLFVGVLLSLFSMFLTLMFVATGSSIWLRFLLFPSLWGACLGFYEAGSRNCVFLAAQGKRDMGHQRESIADPDQADQVRQRAASIHLWTFLTAGLLTLLSLLLPTSLPLPDHWRAN